MTNRVHVVLRLILAGMLGLWGVLAAEQTQGRETQGRETQGHEIWPPAPFEAGYEVRLGDLLLGTAVLRWEWPVVPRPATSDRYRLALTLTPHAAASFLANQEGHEVSEGLILEGQISPRTYRLDSLLTQKGAQQMRFDPSQRSVQTIVGGREKTLEVPDGTLDRLSQLLSLLKALSQNQPTLEIPVVEKGKLRHYSYRILREGAGRRYRVERTGKGFETTLLEFSETQPMPERIEQTRDGMRWRLRLIDFRRL